MAIAPGARRSRLRTCLAAGEARLTSADKAALWQRQILNPFVFKGYHG